MARPSDPNARIDLLSAAEQLFVKRGLDDTKVEDITERAGRSKGSFYLHFQNKEEAFKHVVEGQLARLRVFLDRVAERDREPPVSLEALFDTWLAANIEIFDFVWQNRGVMRLVLYGGRSATFTYLMDEFAVGVRRQIFDALTIGVDRGIYRTGLDLEITSLVMAGAYDRIARQLVDAETKPDLAKILRAVDHVLLGGIGSDSVRAYLTSKSVTKKPTPKTKASR